MLAVPPAILDLLRLQAGATVGMAVWSLIPNFINSFGVY